MGRTVDEIRAEAKALREAEAARGHLDNTRAAELREELAVAARAQFGAATCGRRMTEMGPWEYREGLDWWEPQPNGERDCSFCGSMHPEDFDRFLDKVIADPDIHVRVGVTDKRYKFYVQRPEIKNAMEGPIKFYTHHAPAEWLPVGSPAQVKLQQACRVSAEKFEQVMAEGHAKMIERARAAAEG